MKFTSKTTVKETYTWNEESLRKLLAEAAGISPEDCVIHIQEGEDHDSLAGNWYEPAHVSLTRTRLVSE